MDTGLFEAVPDALLIVDADGRIVRANANAHRLFGHAPGALVGLPVEALMPESVRNRHAAHRTAYADTPRVRPMGAGGMALVGQRRDGEQFPVEIALAPVGWVDGTTQFLASVRDISETLRARQALERARYDRLIAQIGQEALEARSTDALVNRLPERLVAALHDQAQVGLWLRRPGERAAWLAVSDERIRALDPADFPLAMASEVRVLADDPADAQAMTLTRALPGSRVCAITPLLDRGEATGALIAWSHSASRFDHDAQHLLQSAATLVSALMQRSRTEAQLAHSQRLDSLGQLTGGIAHDFNNLLTVMSGSLQLMAAEPKRAPDSNPLIESALRAVRRGADLTDKLLAFGRRKQLRPEAIDAAHLLTDIRLLLERTLGESVRLRVDIAEGIRPAFADASQLDAALVNLALNARDAMPEGGEIALIVREHWITAERDALSLAPGHYVVYSVADTGTGMAREVAARAIEPFFTTKEGRGSGLGLSMVYGFVQQSGGGMEIRSALGAGTEVRLYLPAAPAAVVEPTRAAASRDDTPRPGKALVVEDDDAVRAISAAFMRSLGYEVVAVPDHAAALARLGDDGGGFGVLFSDLMLGSGPDGLALARHVRAHWPAMGVVLTSGHAHGIQAGPLAFEVLAKPYDRDQLAAALARCTRRSASPEA